MANKVSVSYIPTLNYNNISQTSFSSAIYSNDVCIANTVNDLVDESSGIQFSISDLIRRLEAVENELCELRKIRESIIVLDSLKEDL